jgi:hypothetical protein
MNAQAIVNRLLEADPDAVDPQRYLNALPQRLEERWCFTEAEVLSFKVNPNLAHLCLRTNLCVAFVQKHLQTYPILVYRNGKATNRWRDGTAGVPGWLQKRAEAEETLESFEGEVMDNWLNVYTDEAGNLLDFA